MIKLKDKICFCGRSVLCNDCEKFETLLEKQRQELSLFNEKNNTNFNVEALNFSDNGFDYLLGYDLSEYPFLKQGWNKWCGVSNAIK